MQTVETFYNTNRNYTYKFQQIPPTVDKFTWITTGLGKIPYIPLNITGPWKDILEEAKKVDHLFVRHRDDGYSKGWYSLCVHGLGATKTDAVSVYPEYDGIPYEELPFTWTEIAELCPITTDYFKNTFPYTSYQRLRFMKLDPGGYITPHVDGYSYDISAINISLNNPDNCEMVMNGVGVVPFKDSGTVMALNTSYEHMVWNNSNEARYHIIIHGMWDDTWDKIVIKSYESQLM
jgi:hypothetical protein